MYAYRSYGHLKADLDPLGIQKKPPVPELEPERYGLTNKDRKYNLTGIVHLGKKNDPSLPRESATIDQILAHLNKTYCGKLAFEFRHIPNVSERRWFSHMVESREQYQLALEERRRIHELLSKSEVFDQFMTKRFPQVKRYGLEGAESMLVALDNLFRMSSQANIKDLVLCMPHRGRLNLLTDLLEYSPTALFHKIKGKSEFPDDLAVSGDVLSHLANSISLKYGNGKSVHVTMLHNPSHLEAVNPVAMGKARAKQMEMIQAEGENCSLGDKVMCIQIHGDAAFTGQGVVMEALGLSNLPHFTSGGSVHLVVNNQLGYTTPAMNARSSIYASDVGKMINAPVIHVNGDFPEEVSYAASLAFEYRNKFRKDVILDVMTYRRWGHNELDEPAFTQPSMYKIIRSRKSVPKQFEELLLKDKVISAEDTLSIRNGHFKTLDEHLQQSETYIPKSTHLSGKWSSMIHPNQVISQLDTGVDIEKLKGIGKASVEVPEGFKIHPRLEKFHRKARISKLEAMKNIDWATAEAMALGSLLMDGRNVRLSGQDVGRGTFSQRHLMLVDQNSEKTVLPLNEMSENQGNLEVANSSLSEFAVMGFEYGMSLNSPNDLVIWEAQFGDFFNGAQVIIDTYLSSGEQKWLRQSGLVLLLPHGYDGAGPEHSSCRIERFLQNSDDPFDMNSNDNYSHNINWHFINPSTPAQYFHALRRQMERPFRKPLIVASPKTLLKSSDAVSNLSEFAPGTSWMPVIDDEKATKDNVQKLVFVSGKFYYDLLKQRDQRSDIALIRLEELTPFPTEEVKKILSKYDLATEHIWCQEEPQNMGAFSFVQPRLQSLLPEGSKLKYAGRSASAAPATGIGRKHKMEHQEVIKSCFD